VRSHDGGDNGAFISFRVRVVSAVGFEEHFVLVGKEERLYDTVWVTDNGKQSVQTGVVHSNRSLIATSAVVVGSLVVNAGVILVV